MQTKLHYTCGHNITTCTLNIKVDSLQKKLNPDKAKLIIHLPCMYTKMNYTSCLYKMVSVKINNM